MKTPLQYRLEALERVKKIAERTKKKKKKKKPSMSLFHKVSTGNYLIRMVKQERE
tara:strand:+ start:696 stop:860 length:165 start_codon:yes stop_codon:yes gene_type:complete